MKTTGSISGDGACDLCVCLASAQPLMHIFGACRAQPKPATCDRKVFVLLSQPDSETGVADATIPVGGCGSSLLDHKAWSHGKDPDRHVIFSASHRIGVSSVRMQHISIYPPVVCEAGLRGPSTRNSTANNYELRRPPTPLLHATTACPAVLDACVDPETPKMTRTVSDLHHAAGSAQLLIKLPRTIPQAPR